MEDRVLIVDDDQTILTMMGHIITANGLEYDAVESGEAALKMIAERDYAVLLLDINMHGMDGFEVIQRIRAGGSSLPIIIISGRKTDNDTVHGLEIGADDYITKPFNPVTLGAKVRALLRRSRTSAAGASVIKAGPFTYDNSTLRLYKNGEEVILSAKENAMMKLFLDNPDVVIARDMIYDMVWGGTIQDANTVAVYINRLRQKVEDDPSEPRYIQNIRGIGYRFSVKTWNG